MRSVLSKNKQLHHDGRIPLAIKQAVKQETCNGAFTFVGQKPVCVSSPLRRRMCCCLPVLLSNKLGLSSYCFINCKKQRGHESLATKQHAQTPRGQHRQKDLDINY